MQLPGDAHGAGAGAELLRRLRGRAARDLPGRGRLRPRHRLPRRRHRRRRGGRLLPAGHRRDRRGVRLRTGRRHPPPRAGPAAELVLLRAPLPRRGRDEGPARRPAARRLAGPRAGVRPAAAAGGAARPGHRPPRPCARHRRRLPGRPLGPGAGPVGRGPRTPCRHPGGRVKVLLLAQFYPPVIGGEERHVRNLAVALAARGHEVHVATLDTGGAEGPVADPGVRVHLLDNVGRRVPALYPTADRPLALPVPDPLTVRDLARVVREVRPDVAHAHNWIIASWLAVPSARHVPLVHSLHDYGHVCPTKRLMFQDAPCSGPAPAKCFGCTTDHYGRGRGPVVQAAVRAGLPARRRAVDVFTPVSRYVADANRLDEQGVRWQVVPNFVPDELADQPAGPRTPAAGDRDPALPTAPYLFFAGDLSEQKGVATLLRAWERLRPGDRPELVLVGRPTMDLSGVPAGVHVHHHWDHARVLSGFRHALAAALPSEWPDPCPTTVLEAMAVGAPLVTTAQGGIADMVAHEESALVVPAGDALSLTAALQRLVDEPELRARLVRGASAHVRRFLQSRVAADLEGIYDSLV
ncbi:glycosyltransferase [Nocardioides sp. zg-578]|nr:glycosyltransferase [Nocardioides marmotae]